MLIELLLIIIFAVEPFIAASITIKVEQNLEVQ
jgi:hypothetical protein